MIELAMDGFYRMDYERCASWARAGAEHRTAARRPAADRGRASPCSPLGARPAEPPRRREAHRSEAAALVADLDDDELALRLDAAANLAGAELYLDRYEEAGAHAAASAVRRLARRARASSSRSRTRSSGRSRLLRGQLAEAGELLDAAVEGARLSGNVQALAGNLVNRSLTALAAGDLEMALATAEESVELTQGLDQSLVSRGRAWRSPPRSSRPAIPRRAADLLVASSGGEELPLIPGVLCRAKSLELLTRCWLALGRRSEAARAAAGAQSHAPPP